MENRDQYLPYYSNGHVGKNVSCGIFWKPPPELHVSVCVCVIMPGWRCQSVASGPSLPLLFTHLPSCFPPFLHTSKCTFFLALTVHAVGPVSITVLFLLRIPYLASPDV